MKLGSLFDGVGGFPYAGTKLGIEPVWASEIDKNCVSITKRHFPEMKHLGDITKINGAEIEPVDIITFGSPCQDLSVAGNRKGLTGERSGLFIEAVRIIKEMRSVTNGECPRYAVWENVPGAFSSNGGEDFRTVIEEIASVAGEGVSIPRPAKRKGRSAVWDRAGGVMGDGWSLAWRTLDAQGWGVPQRRERVFLVADFGGDGAKEIFLERHSLPWDSATGGEAGEGVAAGTESGSGETITVLNDQGGSNINVEKGDVSPTLRTQYAVDFGRVADRIQMNAQKSVCLQSEGGGCGAKTGLYCLPVLGIATKQQAQSIGVKEPNAVAYCVQNTVIGRSDTAGPQGKGWNEEVSFTLDTSDAHAVALGNYCVRKLTPTECERLQGVPDGWTLYGHDGKEMSDSVRYRGLGNGLAAPCALYVLGCIAKREGV